LGDRLFGQSVSEGMEAELPDGLEGYLE